MLRARIGEAAESRFVVVTLECPHCKTKQKVHVTAPPNPDHMPSQYLWCLYCDNEFNVQLPHKIVGGPFPA